MEQWLLVLVVGIALFSFAVAKPGKHARGSNQRRNVKTKRTADCIVAADSLGELFQVIDEVMDDQTSHVMHNLVPGVSGIDVFDASDRVNFLCGLSDVTSLSELNAFITNTGLTQRSVTFLYHMFARYVEYQREVIMDIIAGHENPNYDASSYYSYYTPDEERVQGWYQDLKMYSDIEATGLFAFKLPLYSELADVLSGYPSYGSYTPTEVSDQPMSAHCAIIANDIREMWNALVESSTEYNLNASEEMKGAIKSWTGIDMNAGHGHIRQLICSLLGNMESEGIDGVYSFMQANDIFTHLVPHIYYDLLSQWEYAEYDINNGLHSETSNDGSPYYPYYQNNEDNYGDYPVNHTYVSGGYGYGYYSGSYEASPETIAILTALENLLNALEAMGLKSLTNDLTSYNPNNMYTYY